MSIYYLPPDALAHLPADIWNDLDLAASIRATVPANVYDADTGGALADPGDAIGRIEDGTANSIDLKQSNASLRPIFGRGPAARNLILNSGTEGSRVVPVTPGVEHVISFLAGSSVVDIDETIAVTAVDGFVYDTSKDSDGGAWRTSALAQASSWYNETLNTATRGSRREFPEVAVVIAEASKITIYDGDDPALPMWMVFNSGFGLLRYLSNGSGGGVTSVTARNGTLVTGSGGSSSSVGYDGACVFNFVADTAERYSSSGAGYVNPVSGLDQRNNQGYPSGTNANRVLVSSSVNDVAMTVLDGAPTDPSTGLPVPTIAVATDGGVSVIKDDGTVADSASTNDIGEVLFTKDGGLWYFRTSASVHRGFYASSDDYRAGDGFGDEVVDERAGIQEITLLTRSQSAAPHGPSGFALGGYSGVSSDAVNGLMLHQPNYADFSKGMSALITSTYNTGWMVGDIKGSFLSDTDDTDLVGATPLDENFSAYADTTEMKAAGWSSSTSTGTGDISLVSGAMQLDCDGTSNRARGSRSFTTVVGATYVVEYTSTDNHHFRVGTSENGSNNVALNNQPVGVNTLNATFTATATTTYVTWEGFNFAGSEPQIDNVSVKLADNDRSVNGNGLIINGTVTRTEVATGSDLVAYSGFSASNYLEQPYNSDLDFGTGDFSVMGWSATNDTYSTFVRLGTASGSPKISVGTYPSPTTGNLSAYVLNATVLEPDVLMPEGWFFWALVRESGTATLYVNGESLMSVSAPADLSLSGTETLRVGIRHDGAQSLDTGSLALIRISATAPTAEQIARIYADELPLFQQGAACTLYGADDAVDALAHDPDTGLLHAGTSAGRSVFYGFNRVNNTTNAVGTFIDAANGVIAEQ